MGNEFDAWYPNALLFIKMEILPHSNSMTNLLVMNISWHTQVKIKERPEGYIYTCEALKAIVTAAGSWQW